MGKEKMLKIAWGIQGALKGPPWGLGLNSFPLWAVPTWRTAGLGQDDPPREGLQGKWLLSHRHTWLRVTESHQPSNKSLAVPSRQVHIPQWMTDKNTFDLGIMPPAVKVHGETCKGAAMKWSSLIKIALGQGHSYWAEGNEASMAISWQCRACLTNATTALEWSAQLSKASKVIRRAWLSEPAQKIFKNSPPPPIRTCLYLLLF